MIRLLIFCRSYVMGEGLKKLLCEDESISVIAIGCSEEEFQWMTSFEHDLIVCDGVCFEIIMRKFPQDHFRLLLVNDSSCPDVFYSHLQDLVARGLVGILSPTSDSGLLLKAVQTVYAGEMWIDHETIRKSLCFRGTGGRDLVLTKREKQVLFHICAGESNKAIAQKLFVTEQTVKSHCNKLFKKFGVSNRVGLALKGQEATSVLGLN